MLTMAEARSRYQIELLLAPPIRAAVVERAVVVAAMFAVDAIARSRMSSSRTQLGNQIRGLLAECGIVLPLHLRQVREIVLPHMQCLTPPKVPARA